jgi:hypothetical protein
MADNPFLGDGAVVAGRSIIPQASIVGKRERLAQAPRRRIAVIPPPTDMRLASPRESLVPMLRNPNPTPQRRVNTAVVKLKERFVAAAPNVKKPGVYLYSEIGMHGSAKYFPPGFYPDLAKYGFSNRARSLSIGPGTSISIYTAKNRGGIATQYANGNAAPFGIADLTIFSNAIQSMQVKA